MRCRIQQAVAEGKGPKMFHDGYAAYFPGLGEHEYIVGIWQGLVYAGARSAASQVAGGVLNQVSASTVGVSTYTPTVMVAVTTFGSLIIAEEYSDFGQRGHYKEVAPWSEGARAVTGPSAIPEHSGPAPKNPFNPTVQLELAVVQAPSGEQYHAWLSRQSLEVSGATRPLGAALPISAQQASASGNPPTNAPARPPRNRMKRADRP